MDRPAFGQLEARDEGVCSRLSLRLKWGEDFTEKGSTKARMLPRPRPRHGRLPPASRHLASKSRTDTESQTRRRQPGSATSRHVHSSGSLHCAPTQRARPQTTHQSAAESRQGLAAAWPEPATGRGKG